MWFSSDLQDSLFVLDVVHLLQSDDVVDGEHFQGVVVARGLIPAQRHPGEGACSYLVTSRTEINKGIKFLHLLLSLVPTSTACVCHPCSATAGWRDGAAVWRGHWRDSS